ncbi:MAG: hypothetical protein WBS19_16635 [Candidatus Korobacteraceae bacterium]
MAALLFEKDTPFVPVTPIAHLPSDDRDRSNPSLSFFGAFPPKQTSVRAITSHDHWLTGCNGEGRNPGDDVEVYELATSLVRRPLGGFPQEAPSVSMQQIFTFVRALHILGPSIGDGESSNRHCIMASIAALNEESYRGLTNIGMVPVPVKDFPRWLKYEHRTWFANLRPRKNMDGRPVDDRPADVIEREARYLWLPPDAARRLFRRVAPLVDHETLSKPSIDDATKIEHFEFTFDIPILQNLVQGLAEDEPKSFRSALAHPRFDALFETLVPPPQHARIGSEIF